MATTVTAFLTYQYSPYQTNPETNVKIRMCFENSFGIYEEYDIAFQSVAHAREFAKNNGYTLKESIEPSNANVIEKNYASNFGKSSRF